MGLHAPALLWALGVLSVLLPLVTAVGWARVRGPRAGVIAARMSGIVASQVVALLFMGVALNDYGYFYASWSQVASAAKQAVGGDQYAVAPGTDRVTTGATAGGAGSTMTVVHRSWHGATAQWAQSGRLEQVSLHGAASGLTSPAYVYLPPQYFQPAFRHHRFPVVEVLSGYPAYGPMLVKRLDFQGKLLTAIDDHTARPMVLVLMRPTITFPRDTECTNVPGGPQAETFYTQDVPAIVDRHFRVRPTHWAAAGISTGGYCAVKFALHDPTAFPVAASLSGYYQALEDDTTGDLWGGSPVLRDLDDPEWLLAHQPAPPVHLLLTSSRDEGGSYGISDLQRFEGLVRPPMTVSTMIAASGGHTFSTWDPEIPGALHWLSDELTDRTHDGAPRKATTGRTVRAAPAAGYVAARHHARSGVRLRPGARPNHLHEPLPAEHGPAERTG